MGQVSPEQPRNYNERKWWQTGYNIQPASFWTQHLGWLALDMGRIMLLNLQLIKEGREAVDTAGWFSIKEDQERWYYRASIEQTVRRYLTHFFPYLIIRQGWIFKRLKKKKKDCSTLSKPRRCSLVICKSLDMLVESVSFLGQGSNYFFTWCMFLASSCLRHAEWNVSGLWRGVNWKFMIVFYASRWNLPPHITQTISDLPEDTRGTLSTAGEQAAPT